MDYISKLESAVKFIKSRCSYIPTVGMILGSGLGTITKDIEDAIIIPYHDIPNFPVSNVSGHAGNLVIGRLEGKVVVAMQGRTHFYEGHTMEYITFPVRVMKRLGVEKLLVTNAAGGANESFTAGTLMAIKDHINLMGTSPLIGINQDEFGPRFPDMTFAYDREYLSLIASLSPMIKTPLREGVYAGFTGPNYETPAEVKMARILGADAVGMSTVPEVIVANHCGMRVAGISCITNMAAGVTNEKLDHKEVMEVANLVHSDFVTLVKNLIKGM